MRRFLSGDGGGLMGIFEVTVLARLEEKLDVPLHDVFDVVAGSSTYAIIGAAAAAGIPMSKVLALYTGPGVELFTRSENRNFWLLRPIKGKYKRENFLRVFETVFPRTLLMKHLKTDFFATSVSLVDCRTHFFKSWDTTPNPKGVADSELPVIDVIARSALSAPYYFEPIDDPVSEQVWIDGGSGTENCPFEQCLVEMCRREWTKGKVRIVSLGTGFSKVGQPYKQAARQDSWESILKYVGLARGQSSPSQFDRWKYGWRVGFPKTQIARIDAEVPKEMNVLDGGEFAEEYKRRANALADACVDELAQFVR